MVEVNKLLPGSTQHSGIPILRLVTFRPVAHSFTAFLLALAALLSGPTAHAEQMPLPMYWLAQSPFQIEVTILAVEFKPGPHHGQSVWHRVRIERVMVGDGLKPGDETAVVSIIRENPPGTTGSSGDRGPFAGPNGLPLKGDRARLFASGTAQILKPVSPNGWQPAAQTIALLAADEHSGAEHTMPLLASMIESSGIGSVTLLLAAPGNGTGSAAPTPQANAKEYFLTKSGRPIKNADVIVLNVHGLRPAHNTAIDLAALSGGLPLVALRSSIDTYAVQADDREAGEFSQFGKRTFGTRILTVAPAKTSTRILAPTAAESAHPILAGIEIPSGGLVLPSQLIAVEPLAEDCQVLLWGEAIDAAGTTVGPKQPVLWTREVPRAAPTHASQIAVTLPAQPIAESAGSAMPNRSCPFTSTVGASQPRRRSLSGSFA